MHYVYILKSNKDGKYYIGSTDDLKSRFAEHQAGKVTSTKYRIPFVLVCYEAYQDKLIAQRRERFLKSSDGHKDLHRRLK